MTKILILLCTICLTSFPSSAQTDENITGDYDIKFEVKGLGEDKAILAYYYMDKKYIKDTIDFDQNGIGYLKGEMELNTGVYLLAFPTQNLSYFELILGPEEKFSVETDVEDFIENFESKGSKENALFYENMKFLLAQGRVADNLQAQAKELDEESADYLAIHDMLTEMNRAVKARRAKLIEDHPDAFYAQIIKAMSEVEMPPNPNPTDSSYAYHFYQQHYFDNVDFSDNRLTRTPFMLKKITDFLDNYTIPIPDSINAAAERIINKSMADYEMFQFCLVGIFNKYAKSKIMSHELVYVNLAKKYYLSGKADWASEEQLKTFRERITKMEPTMLGKKAPQIIIQNYEEQLVNLYDQSPNGYVVLTFWNSSCGHCKKEMPRLKEIYNTELAPLGEVSVFAVSTELETDEWKKFIAEHDLLNTGWVHSHDPEGRNQFRYLYNIESTPLVLVLGPDREILAKRINIDDIKSLVEYDMRSRKRVQLK